MKNDIDVIVACGKNSERFVEFLIHTIQSTASQESNFRFLLGVNDDFVDFEKLKNIKTNYEIRVFDCKSPGVFSYGHGEALDILFKHVTTKYCLVVDCDVAFLHKNWDKIFIEKLEEDPRIAIIGNEYDLNSSKYKNFPNLVTSMFKTDILRQCDVSWKPAHESLRNKILIDETNHLIFSKNIGETIDLDTGWELCFKLKTNGYKGIFLPLYRKSNNDFCLFLKDGVRGEEHRLDDKVISTHIGRSFTRSFDSEVVILWKNTVEEFIKEKKYEYTE